MLISGLYDIAPLRYSDLQPAVQFDDGIVQRNSPVRHARPCKTPLLLAWGGNEQQAFAQQSEALLPLEQPGSVLCQAVQRFAF